MLGCFCLFSLLLLVCLGGACCEWWCFGLIVLGFAVCLRGVVGLGGVLWYLFAVASIVACCGVYLTLVMLWVCWLLFVVLVLEVLALLFCCIDCSSMMLDLRLLRVFWCFDCVCVVLLMLFIVV